MCIRYTDTIWYLLAFTSELTNMSSFLPRMFRVPSFRRESDQLLDIMSTLPTQGTPCNQADETDSTGNAAFLNVGPPLSSAPSPAPVSHTTVPLPAVDFVLPNATLFANALHQTLAEHSKAENRTNPVTTAPQLPPLALPSFDERAGLYLAHMQTADHLEMQTSLRTTRIAAEAASGAALPSELLLALQQCISRSAAEAKAEETVAPVGAGAVKMISEDDYFAESSLENGAQGKKKFSAALAPSRSDADVQATINADSFKHMIMASRAHTDSLHAQ